MLQFGIFFAGLPRSALLVLMLTSKPGEIRLVIFFSLPEREKGGSTTGEEWACRGSAEGADGRANGRALLAPNSVRTTRRVE